MRAAPPHTILRRSRACHKGSSGSDVDRDGPIAFAVDGRELGILVLDLGVLRLGIGVDDPNVAANARGAPQSRRDLHLDLDVADQGAQVIAIALCRGL